MSDLYVKWNNSNNLSKASRSDVLEWLGWGECEGCDGGGNRVRGEYRGDTVWADCPNCLSGLVPPASQVEAAGDGIEALGYDTLELRNWGEGSVPGAIDIVARAALIAAMREGVGDE